MKIQMEHGSESFSGSSVTHRAIRETRVSRFVGLKAQLVVDVVAVEEPLEIQLGYGPRYMRRVKSISVTMRTPGQDFALAAGFLLTEGVVRDVNDIERVVGTLFEGFGRLVTSPPYLVGCARWDARSDRFLLARQSLQQLFSSQSALYAGSVDYP